MPGLALVTSNLTASSAEETGALSLNADCCVTQTTFTDGQGLFREVCERGLKGIVAKRAASTYRPGLRGWVKVKNPGYWRRDQELAALRRSLERRAATASS